MGELPPKLVAVRREARAYRRGLEAEVERVKGDITTTDAHHIDTASAATIQAAICRWLLRHKLGTMTTADIRGCTSDMVKAKERRDAAVKALALDVDPRQDAIDALYTRPASTDNGEPDDEATNATP